MLTIKLPYKAAPEFLLLLEKVRKQYSSAVRYSYKRFLEGNTSQSILHLLNNNVDNISLLGGFIKLCAISDAKALKTRFKGKTNIIFGGKFNFKQHCKGKISKEEFRERRLLPLNIQGDTLKKGNRHFNLKIIEENTIVFKLNKNEHHILTLPKLSKNYKEKLFKLQGLATGCKTPYSVKLTNTHICISFEEFKEEQINLNENRYLGIDLNPDTIGISVLENEKVIHAQEFSLKPIFNKILNEKLSSNSNRVKYFQNKLKFETFEVSKSISLIAKKFNCKSVFIEDLHFKGSSTVKISNRKNKNLWKRELFINNLTKRLNILGIKLYSVNPAYSSFIGNFQYDYTDAINASIEIARRGYEYRIKENKNSFYPPLFVKHQWKEMIANVKGWKELFVEIKNSKIKYRVSLKEAAKQHHYSVFSLKHKKSGISCIILNV